MHPGVATLASNAGTVETFKSRSANGFGFVELASALPVQSSSPALESSPIVYGTKDMTRTTMRPR